MLVAKDLKKKFKETVAVDSLNLSVCKGEIYGFLGPNGAGKTTTIRIFSTLTFPTSGQALINGFDVVKDPVRAKQQIGVVHQNLNIDPDLTGFENLIIHGFLFGMSLADIRRRGQYLLEFVGLEPDIHRQVQEYSGGMRRRLTIARALLHSPLIMIMDEPTAGLDAVARRKVWSLIRDIRQNGGTVFLTTHYIEEAAYLSDRVGILDKGRLIIEDTPQNLISRFGKTTVDVHEESGLEIEIFDSRTKAVNFVAKLNKDASIRDTNLEDVFIKLTGRRASLRCQEKQE